jgi:hypothetical protein
LLVLGVVAFVWVSDLQGVLRRTQAEGLARWLRPGLTYAVAAILALWQWDRVVRTLCNVRFAVLAALTAGAIALASSRPAPSVQAEVPVLRAGELPQRPVVTHVPAAASAAGWVLPATSHADVAEEQDRQQQPRFAFDLPAGWTELPGSAMRLVNLRVAGDPRAECYLSSLPRAGGGMLENVNRWRNQMGLAAIDAEALGKLPRAQLLGRDAVLVELDGTFTGMDGTAVPEARMLGAIAALPAVTLFLKMTGPRDLLQRERAGFDKVLGTLRMADAAPPPGSAPPSHPAASAPSGERLRWTVPEGWQAGPDRPMRLVTMSPAGAAGVECYVTVLPGAAGGVLDNLNRWRDQFGLDKSTEAELKALPGLEVFGRPAPLIELRGTFTGMSGGAQEGYGLLGTIVPLADRVVFVKMTGPQARVQEERARFLQFCGSLRAE